MSGAAVNACAWSAYINFLFKGQVVNMTQLYVAHWESAPRPLSTQPDLLAALIVLVIVVIISLGANCSSKINAVIVCINVLVLSFTSVVGFAYADLDNWRLKDKGGFLPYGFGGVLSGSTACFWAMSGYEASATSIEEAKTPHKSIPIATFIAIIFVTVLYVLTSSAITLLTPFDSIDSLAPLPSAFAARDITWAKYIVLFGPLCGLTTTLLNAVFSFVRMVYAMSNDGLLFPFLSKVHNCSHIPLWSVFICCIVVMPIACFMDMKDIFGFGVILALLQYTLISVIVMLLRYQPAKEQHTSINTNVVYSNVPVEQISLSNEHNFDEDGNEMLLNSNGDAANDIYTSQPHQTLLKPSMVWLSKCLCCYTDYVIPVVLFCLVVSCSVVGTLLCSCYHLIVQGNAVVIIVVVFLSLLSLMIVGILAAHKQNVTHLVIKVSHLMDTWKYGNNIITVNNE